ncbi:MAG TPA: gamma-glutamyltransferase family protein [Acetobacteraceae bacterium]|nr:gamma-glutamyltransferase family protein [Acetobacteraceae bacterium]
MRDYHLPGRSPVYATHGMAATSMPAATLTALDVLRQGGNALDAAVAACAVLCVIEPQSTGIGGDCFCLYAPAGEGKVVALNGSGRAPAAATIDWYEQAGIAAIENTSAHAVTVPGALSAWETLLKAHGRKYLDELLQPAIRFAADGWPVHPKLAWDWKRLEGKLRKNGTHHFLPGGKAPAPGDIFVQPALAETLRAVARHGAKAFYEGPIAADMVKTLRERGGLHTEADVAAGLHGADFVDPISLNWRGYDVFECPPNGQGIVALIILGILGGMTTAADGPLGVERMHRHIEAGRLAYRDRDAFVADPTQADVPVAKLLSPDYLSGLRALIRDDVAMPVMPLAGETLLAPHRDTIYLCVVDRDGNACSFINSLFEGFGSAILAEQCGVMLQNRGFGFRVERGHPNCIAPRKRPMHTIIPGMLMQDGQAVMPFGVMGGHYQPMGHSWFLANMLEYGLDIQEAIDLPRLLPRLGKLQIERGIPAEAVARLTRMGHDPELVERPHGGGQAIWIDRDRGCLVAGSEPRKDGLALGY